MTGACPVTVIGGDKKYAWQCVSPVAISTFHCLERHHPDSPVRQTGLSVVLSGITF